MIALSLPFAGRWLAVNSPARRVPSHGTDLFGERYAIDFVAVDERRRTAETRDWRTLLATEPPERFLGFGLPILAPADGVVVAVHDGEPDHVGRRSQFALLPYALGQAGRVRQGADAVAGNRVVLRLADGGPHLALVHLREKSLRVAAGERVRTGQRLAECGNSGNSTQPHLHLQAMGSLDLATARGVPVEFERYREWTGRAKHPRVVERGVPAERSVVEALPG